MMLTHTYQNKQGEENKLMAKLNKSTALILKKHATLQYDNSDFGVLIAHY